MRAVNLLRDELVREHEHRRDHDERVTALIAGGVEALRHVAVATAEGPSQVRAIAALGERVDAAQLADADHQARLDRLEQALSETAREQERGRATLDQLGADLTRLHMQTVADLDALRRDHDALVFLASPKRIAGAPPEESNRNEGIELAPRSSSAGDHFPGPIGTIDGRGGGADSAT